MVYCHGSRLHRVCGASWTCAGVLMLLAPAADVKNDCRVEAAEAAGEFEDVAEGLLGLGVAGCVDEVEGGEIGGLQADDGGMV